jgi:hypothetical protein
MINVKKINIQDFTLENQSDISKLARSLNPFFDDIQRTLNKGLTVNENLPFEYATFEVSVDALGVPLNLTRFSINLKETIKGSIVINAESSNSSPTGTPYVSFSVNSNILTINKVFGIPSNIKFKLTILLMS